jgi:hypothetical protein
MAGCSWIIILGIVWKIAHAVSSAVIRNLCCSSVLIKRSEPEPYMIPAVSLKCVLLGMG